MAVAYHCYAACLRVRNKQPNLGASKLLLKPTCSFPSSSSRPISRLLHSATGNRLFLVDTLALVRKMEAQGVPSKHAEAITAAATEVLNEVLENVDHSFVSKAKTQKIEMIQESNLSKFKAKVQSSQENHFSLLQHETAKLLGDIEKMRSELSYEIDKVTAGQRLDLNLEGGKLLDELMNQNQQTINLTNKLDREIHEIRAQLEAAKYEVIKYCIGHEKHFFDDSVPSTPFSRAGNSPPGYGVRPVDPFFDNSSRFDSLRLSMPDDTFSPRRETFSTFDSINNTRGMDYNQGTLTRFDSINSNVGYDRLQ